MTPGKDTVFKDTVFKDTVFKAVQETTPSIASRVGIVAYYALLSRLAIWFIAVVSHALIQDYDSALELVLPVETIAQQFFKGIFGVFLRWDSFYFVHIAEHGYVFEQEHAFFPLLPVLMRLVSNTVLAPLSSLFSYTQQLVLAGILVSNVSFIAASVQLYRLTHTLFGQERFAFLTAILYILTPSGIFMSAIYTESPFAALSFTGMLFAARRQYLLAAVVWSISCTARSNGVLYPGFFIYDLVVRMDLKAPMMSNIKALLKTTVLCLINWAGFLSVQGYGYALYCSNKTSMLEARPWCESTVPSIYTFVQDFYWNVGFLRYYEMKQIPNFLMAAPMITLSAAGIFCYASYDLQRLFSLGRSSNKASKDRPMPPFLSLATFPYIVLWTALLFSAITTMHIQIITRAFSCVPPVYWFAAHQFEEGAPGAGWSKSITTFFVMYGLIGIILFANFFPPA
ncbi:GPI mannosyltransferase 2 [Gamsiella multidivaricata]|uniref:GPI mannosyltransferase 2 n=1 Tax=Gamsiella multidivaricata TaxID=101098 RepID=UPI00221E8E75|nr:GPI mannosyltransferase 2 [Gamsiella multidivaricata]KAI7816542.1 GPI mannosyltransferase 2 [Gamsiella multidivaricata]